MPDSVVLPRRWRWFHRLATWFLVLVAGAWLALAAAFGVLRAVIVPNIDASRSWLQLQASKALGVEVQIEQIQVLGGWFTPEFELRNVRLGVSPAAGAAPLKLERAVVGISPLSLVRGGIEHAVIDQPDLEVRRDAAGRWTIAGLPLSSEGEDNQASDWVLNQPVWLVRGGRVRWIDEQRAAPPLVLTMVDAQLRNRGLRHELRVDATPEAGLGSRSHIQADLREPVWGAGQRDWQRWSGRLFAEFPQVDVARLSAYLPLHMPAGAQVRSASGGLRVWADVRDAQIGAVTADLGLRDVDLKVGSDMPALALAELSTRLEVQLAPGFDQALERLFGQTATAVTPQPSAAAVKDWRRWFRLAQRPGAVSADTSYWRTQGLRFRGADGVEWPRGDLSFQLKAGAAGAPDEGAFTAQRVDLNALAILAARLPLGSAIHAQLASFEPSGVLEAVEAQWRGPLVSAAQFKLRGQVQNLHLKAQAASTNQSAQRAGASAGTVTTAELGRPGLSGVSVAFDLNERGGKAQVSVNNGSLSFPGVFEAPTIALDRLSATLALSRSVPTASTSSTPAAHWGVTVTQASFANADAAGNFTAHWHTSDPNKSPNGARFPGYLDLQATLERAKGTAVYRYLPQVISQDARDYVRDAVRSGTPGKASVRLKGELFQMPFADGSGEFRISVPVKDAVFEYVPQRLTGGRPAWPAFTNLDGILVFERDGMRIEDASARVQGHPGLAVVGTNATIASFSTSPTVVVTGQIRATMGDMLGFVNASPVGGIMGQALARAKASGSGDLRLSLSLPLEDLSATKVQGSLTVADGAFQFSPDTPRIERARGLVRFNERGVVASGVQAHVLGGDARLDMASAAFMNEPNLGVPPTMRLRVSGVATAEGLRQAAELGWISRLATRVQGSSTYTAELQVRPGGNELSVESSLLGLALNLPAPLNKPAAAAWPLQFTQRLRADAPGHDSIRVEVGGLASLQYERQLAADAARVLRGSIALGLSGGETAVMPPSGVAANLAFDRIDVDAWLKVFELIEGGSTAASSGASSSQAAVVGSAAAPAQAYLPDVFALRATALTAGARTFNRLVVGGSRDGLLWRMNASSAELNGYAEYRQPRGTSAGRVYARLSHLNVPAATAKEFESLLDEQPASVPALDIVIDDLELRDKKLGRVEIEAVNRGVSNLREWRLNKLVWSTPEMTLSGSGNWVALDAQSQQGAAASGRRRMALRIDMDIADSGAFLARVGFPGTVRRGKGKLTGQIGWVGSPLALDTSSLTGQINLNIEAGQFLKADPGIAKLLGVLSLQSLPRRLALDFRDVFSEGFAFDFIRGDARIERGVMTTNNLQMKGVTAAVLMEGSADLLRETQALNVVVVPEINAGTMSLIAATINPAVGLGTFLAQWLLRRPINDAATQRFRIEGSFGDPRVTRVESREAVPSGPGSNTSSSASP